MQRERFTHFLVVIKCLVVFAGPDEGKSLATRERVPFLGMRILLRTEAPAQRLLASPRSNTRAHSTYNPDYAIFSLNN